jgi:hypothetical protein
MIKEIKEKIVAYCSVRENVYGYKNFIGAGFNLTEEQYSSLLNIDNWSIEMLRENKEGIERATFYCSPLVNKVKADYMGWSEHVSIRDEFDDGGCH